MVKTVPLKSISTGLVGMYPETHLQMDPDLVLVTSDPEPCVDCWQTPEDVVDVTIVDDAEQATALKRKN